MFYNVQRADHFNLYTMELEKMPRCAKKNSIVFKKIQNTCWGLRSVFSEIFINPDQHIGVFKTFGRTRFGRVLV